MEGRPIGLGYASVSLVVGEGELAKGRTERDHWTHRRVTHTHKEQRAEGGRLVVHRMSGRRRRELRGRARRAAEPEA